MKRNYLKLISLFTLAGLFITGCQKEEREFNEDITKQSTAARSEKGGGCRVTSYDYYDPVNDYHQVDQYTYKNGLVDEWLTFYGSVYKMEYDSKRKLTIARLYEGPTLLNEIHFIYNKNKVVKEVWYDVNTQQVIDEVNITYNQKGEMIRNESTAFDYYVTYTYTIQGDLKSWFFFVGGLPAQKAEYTFLSEFKNPLIARPGIEYSFAWGNSAFGTGKGWYSSEKVTLYDAEGSNPFVYYDHDPLQTIWQPGSQNYPIKATYFDRLSDAHNITNSFEYENCPGSNNDAKRESLRQKNGISNSIAPALNFRSLIRGPKKMLTRLK
jgi:hypothetical protein